MIVVFASIVGFAVLLALIYYINSLWQDWSTIAH